MLVLVLAAGPNWWVLVLAADPNWWVVPVRRRRFASNAGAGELAPFYGSQPGLRKST